jgi:hypothetical protein
MSAPEKRMAWALLVGAIVTGLMAGDTNSWGYNWLVGLVPGVFAWLAAWIVLEGIAWNVREDKARQPTTAKSNVRAFPQRSARDDQGRSQ